MLYNHFTEKLIGLQHIEVEKIEKTENSIHIFCKLKRVPHKCPCCGTPQPGVTIQQGCYFLLLLSILLTHCHSCAIV